jgi:chemotaxis signal transduction protein
LNRKVGERKPLSSSTVSTGRPLDELIAKLDEEFRGASPTHLLGADRAARRRLAASQTKCVLARAAGNDLAIRMENVVEILTPPKITFVPNVPDWLIGVTNLRGDVVSVCDLRLFLGLERPPADADFRVVVVRSLKDETATGLVVDGIEGIRGLSLANMPPPSVDLPESLAPYVVGLVQDEQRIRLAFDVERLLASPAIRQFDLV